MSLLLSMLLFALWISAVIFFRVYRIWIFYYVLAAVGAAYWMVLIARYLQLDVLVANTVASTVSELSGWLGITTQTFQNAPGLLLVLVVVQKIGWTVLEVGVESSGVLEMCVLSSLLLFYPGWSWKRRLLNLTIGLISTWGANIARMMVIVLLLSEMGKPVLVVAHTFIGKVVFFAITVAIYWVLITRPTVWIVARLLRERGRDVRYKRA